MKRKLKSLLTSFVAALLIASIAVPLAACDNGKGGNKGGNNGTVISVVSMGNKGLEGVTVTVTDTTASAGSADYEPFVGTTNEKGDVSFKLDNSVNYKVEFSDLPKGFYTEEGVEYSIKAGSPKDIKFYLPSEVITGESVDPSYIYRTGDVMYDFSFSAINPEGSEKDDVSVSLAKVLEAKKAVVINFWGSKCSACQSEFPAMEATYKLYGEDFSILALVPPKAYKDTRQSVIDALNSWRINLTFDYGMDSASLYKNFYAPAQNNSFQLPVSAIVDRYGVICEIILGSEASEQQWKETISKYIADDYVPDIDYGKDLEDIENFIPDKPSDFQAQMSDPNAISKAINKTGTDISFYSDPGEYSWPWALSADKNSIVPLGSHHGRSYSIIYADVKIPDGKVLLVDYTVSSYEDYDLFEIVVDANDLGKVSFMDSGYKVNQTALAYAPISPSSANDSHRIGFVYYKGTIKGDYNDTVLIHSLRFVDATSDEIPSSDVSYFAARNFSSRGGVYQTYENFYYDETDGYYHVQGRENKGKNPYLLFDVTHMIPYTRSSSFFEQYINTMNCTFGGRNYYQELLTYSYVAGNSKVEGTVPVTQELKDILDALCKYEAKLYGYEYNPQSWLEFCIFYIHYGAGEAMGNPVEGLAYFSAYEAKLGEDNSITFDTVIVPRGKMAKFTAQEAGVYHFYSIDGENGAPDSCEAELFDGNLNLHAALAKPVAVHDADTLFRDGSPTHFHLYHYLEAGESCYLNVRFFSTETLDTMHYGIEKIHDTEYKVLKTVTAGFLTTSLDPDTLGQTYIPLYIAGLELKEDNYYYETKFNNRILVDFTGATRAAFSRTLEDIIERAKAGTPYKIATKVDENTGAVLESIDVTFNLSDFAVKVGNELIEGKDYTTIMQDYLEQSKATEGLVEANKELRDILTLFEARYFGLEVENEWLRYCYFYEYFGANY